MADSRNNRARQRHVRQEALRDQLTAGGHLQHVIDIAGRLSNEELELDQAMVARLKAAADIKLKLIAKYLPDVKAVEITGEGGGPPKLELTVTYV